MRWRGRQRSDNVEDRRGLSPRGLVLGGGGGLGILLILLLGALMGVDVRPLLNGPGAQIGVPQRQADQAGQAGKDDEAREFVSVVLHDTETVWSQIFAEQVRGGGYKKPRLVLYEGLDRTEGCGPARSEFGPFYCPADETVYIDPAFFYELKNRHRAPGDFAQAYVIAHEVAHHVQNQIGFSQQVDKIRAQGDKVASNRASVRLELQADYLAGVWAHHAHKEYDILESGDIKEAIVAANQIGDDTLLREAGQAVIPARFTHGTSEQRVYWFSKGLKSGDFEACQELFRLPYEEL